METGLKKAFCTAKPFCDVVMVNPSAENVLLLYEAIKNLDKSSIQDIQLYVLYPLITHLKSPTIRQKQDIQYEIVNSIKYVMENSSVKSLEIFTKFHNCLLSLIFDKSQTGMVAAVPEEFKLIVIECLTSMILNMDDTVRLKLFQTLAPLLAQTVFVAVHIAKLEKLRKLRISAMDCVQAYTATHPNLSDHLDIQLEEAAVDLASSILPGVCGALLEVATDGQNPGHGVVVAAIKCLCNVISLVMNNKHLDKTTHVTIVDFAQIIQAKASGRECQNEKAKSPKDVTKRSPEWYTLAGQKLQLVTSSVANLHTHDHPAVRMELAGLCATVLLKCSRTMQPSVHIALDDLISLSKDEYSNISLYCSNNLQLYFQNIPPDIRYKTLDGLTDNFISTLTALPKILNNIDNSRKLSTLNLLHGYLEIMSQNSQLQQVLEVPKTMSTLCDALIEAVRLSVDIKLLATIRVRQLGNCRPLGVVPWSTLRHLEDDSTRVRLLDVCRTLGRASLDMSHALLDTLGEPTADRNELLYLLNHIVSASKNEELIKSVIDTYLEPDLWYLPVEVRERQHDVTSHTMDLDVYNPSSWDKDYVPGLYEGAIETRYTGISYQNPRKSNSGYDVTLSAAISNMAARCLLTEGLGKMAAALGTKYQPYLLRTLCLVLERIGSEYEMLHVSGIAAIHDIASACQYNDVFDLIRTNADYFTYQVTTRLKKVWNSESALEMLSVVMEYSDITMFDCFYAIVTDVLLQSCDKYHEQDLTAYLKVFLTFLTCIQKWFPISETDENPSDVNTNDLFDDTLKYIEMNKIEAEEIENEMEIEDKEAQSELEEHENIDNEPDLQPPPQHIQMTEKILKRCLNFIPSTRVSEKLVALKIMSIGLKLLRHSDKLLYPMVHQIWSPLVDRFIDRDVVMIKATELLVTMAELTKDFISQRTIKQVLPTLVSSLKSPVGVGGNIARHVSICRAMCVLATSLPLTDTPLTECINAVSIYLFNKQPKALQEEAVQFFKTCLAHDYGEVWYHLRKLCTNQIVIVPPKGTEILTPVVGTPYETTDVSYNANIQLIFGLR